MRKVKRNNDFQHLKNMEYKKESNSIVTKPAFKAGTVFVCIAVDAVSIFLLLDHILNENYLLTGALVAMSSVALTVIPIMLAKYVELLQIPRKTVLIGASVTCVAGFFLLFVVTFVIRWYSRYTLFDSDASRSYADPASAENGVALFLGILSLIAAVLCFLIHFSIDERKSRIDTIRPQQIDLREEMSEMDVAISLLEDELENHQLRSIEEEKYTDAFERNQLILVYCKIVARRILAERLKTAESITLLMEENRLAQQIACLLPSDSEASK